MVLVYLLKNPKQQQTLHPQKQINKPNQPTKQTPKKPSSAPKNFEPKTQRRKQECLRKQTLISGVRKINLCNQKR